MMILNKYKNHKEINYNTIAALELAKKQKYQEVVEKGTFEHQIKIYNRSIKNFKVDFEASFTSGLGIAFRDMHVDDLQNKIIDKLEKFGFNWDSADAKKTKKNIISNVLNDEFWREELCINLVDQNIRLK